MAGEPDTNRPLHVLIVHDSLSWNGGVRQTLDLAGRLARLGADTEVYALQPVRGGREAEVPAGVRVTRGVPPGRRLRSAGAPAAVRLLRASRRADVVVSGSEIGLGLLAGYAAARIARRRFAVVVHAPLGAAIERWVPRRLRKATGNAHRRADAAICVSAGVVDELAAHGVDRLRVHVVPNAVDAEHVRRVAADGPAPPVRAPTIVGLGRLSHEKGFDLLVRAHAELRRKGVEHDLEIVGDGPDREPLRRLASALGVTDSVSLPGFVENAFAHVRRATALVVPSRHDGLPLVLLEGLALGVPVIAARSAGAVGLLSEEQLVPDESVPALAAAIERHLADPDRLRAATREAAAAVAARTPDDVAREYLRVLESLIRGTADAVPAMAAYE